MAGAKETRDGVELTSLDGPAFDGADATKRDLVDYLDAVADRIIPELARPAAVGGAHAARAGAVHAEEPAQVHAGLDARTSVWAHASQRDVAYALCNDRRTLLWFANQRAVEYHPTLMRVDELDRLTHLVLDLDPPPGADFAVAVAAAQLVRAALAEVGLAGAVKTSGAKGLHVFVPIAREVAIDDAAAATRAVAARAAALDPDVATTAFIKEDRGGKVFVDPTRAGGAHRRRGLQPAARPGVPVSFPVGWDDLDAVEARRLHRPHRARRPRRRRPLARAMPAAAASCPPSWWRRATRSRCRGWWRCTRANAAAAPPPRPPRRADRPLHRAPRKAVRRHHGLCAVHPVYEDTPAPPGVRRGSGPDGRAMATLREWRAGRDGDGSRWWGRSAELSELLGLCAGEQGGAVVVAGPAGVGESACWTSSPGMSLQPGRWCCAGRRSRAAAPTGRWPRRCCGPHPQPAKHERLGPFRAVLARLLPGWPTAPAAREYVVDPVVVLGEAVLELLRVVAAGRRCVLLLDDLHWADRDTLQLLEYLGPALTGEPVVLVCAARDDEPGGGACRRRLPVLPLRKLPPEDVALLARHCADGPVSDELGRFLTAAADGLPLLVEELFTGLVEDGRVLRDALGWHSAAPLAVRVPEAFADVVRQRLEQGLPETRHGRLVRTAAGLGGEPEWRLIAAATGVDPGVVAAALPGGGRCWSVRRRRRGAALATRARPRGRAWDTLSPPERAHRCPRGRHRAEPGAR